VLEAIAAGEPLGAVLHRIAQMIDLHAPTTQASILLLDPDTGTVRHGAAPGLPAAFFEAIDGARIGPHAGSCGTAAYLGKPVFVEDIARDPLWEDWRALALAHDLRACWSTPFFDKDGRVLGTFAIYAKVPRLPGEEDLRLIQLATHLTGVAVENRRLQERLRALAGHLENVREEERTAIAREIHDVVGQSITALKLDLSRIDRAVRGGLSGAAIHEALEGPLGMTDELLGQVQRISGELRPGVLDQLGLSAAIEWQARELTRRTGIRCAVVDRLGEARLEPPIATAAFRIFQEALTNVTRHAKAKTVEVALERSEDQLRLAVRDDGRGIPKEALGHPRSLGLLGMHERAARLGGTVRIGPSPGGGTQMELRLPVRPEARA
jgi:signal transduction histidine kinase